MNDIEKEFNSFVQEFGGTLVCDLVGVSPPFSNADYIFEKYHIIAEFKCLEENKIVDPKFIDKASSIHLEARQKGGTQTVLFGTRMLTSENFTPEYQERLIKLYEQPVQQKSIKKANEQIRDTKKNLGKNAYDGVLLLINSGNLALDPAHVVQLINRILSRGLYSSINYAIFMTVNLKAEHPSINGDYIVWVPFCKNETGNENFKQFEEALRKSWQRHLEQNLGIQIPFRTVDDKFFSLLKNKK